VSAGAAVELATSAHAAAGVQGLACVACLAVGEVGVLRHCFAFLDRGGGGGGAVRRTAGDVFV